MKLRLLGAIVSVLLAIGAFSGSVAAFSAPRAPVVQVHDGQGDSPLVP